MQPHRPTSVLVIAIFHFILGGLGLIFGLISVASSALVYAQSGAAAPSGPAGPAGISVAAQNQFLESRLPYWKEIGLAFNLIDLAISVLMLVAGFGLLQMKPWGRTLSLVYVGLSIADQIGRLIFTAFFFLPAMYDFYDSLAGSTGPGLPPGFTNIMKVALTLGVGASLLGLVYPVIVLIIMLRPAVAAAFRGEGAPPDHAADYDDRYDRGGRGEGGAAPEAGYFGSEPPAARPGPDDRIGPAPD